MTLLGLLLISLGLAVAGRQWLEQKPVARFFYYAGLPYLAMVAGLFPARLLGLSGLEHFNLAGPDWARTAPLLLLTQWLLDSRATLPAGLAVCAIWGGVWASLPAGSWPYRPTSLLETTYDALHWAFYRAICWQLTGDLYVGVVLGVGCVLLEWGLLAHVRGLHPQSLFNAMLLILTALVFFYSPNLWLLLPVHLALVWLGGHVSR
jgi:hypothetical protein